MAGVDTAGGIIDSVGLPDHLQPLVTGALELLSADEQQHLTCLIKSYSDIFASPDGKLGWNDQIRHTIGVGTARFASRGNLALGRDGQNLHSVL